MKLLRGEGEVSALCRRWREDGLTIGFVPTMGALHQGHLSLVKRALELSDRVIVSIFLNPAQFGENEDLSSYPRNLSEDCRLLDESGASAVFAPEPSVVYPEGFSTSVEVSGLTDCLCGAYREGHFRGVTTVCAVLFGIVRPHLAVFGEKDAQQLAVIRRMVQDLRLDLKIVSSPIVRELDGLAMSSRNAYLSREQRQQASAIHRGLEAASELRRRGVTRCDALRNRFREEVEKHSLLRIQYAETVDPRTMKPVDSSESPVLMAVAVYAGETRLIDNIIIEPEV